MQARSSPFRLRSAAYLFALAGCALPYAAVSACAQDDGARSYFLAPTDVTAWSGQYIRLESNQTFATGIVLRGLEITGDIGLAQIARPFDVLGVMVAPLLIVPFGQVEANFAATRFSLAPGGIQRRNQVITGRSSGLGDAELGVVIGLYGAPPLRSAAYVKYKPGFSVGLLARLTLPTGAYEPGKAINMGANRWGGMIGLPLCYYRGASLLDPALTTFELLPAILFFGDNGSPFGADNFEQEPLFTVEAHVTQNLGHRIWVSLDARYRAGGETTTDGVAGDDRQEAFALGGTLGLGITSKLSLKLTYGEIVERNDDGPDGRMFRVVVGLTF